MMKSLSPFKKKRDTMKKKVKISKCMKGVLHYCTISSLLFFIILILIYFFVFVFVIVYRCSPLYSFFFCSVS
ncbi:hypothetical protein STCU_10258 [Strigomonas culicis]|uniref:Uncharacterized protein n=1 Tax=Strigomonas culicis TaxID=28005 RepID=S9TMK8_9TRYP|nr:hypothetical protein STCU_10258 [Strigomonas culicis]|eukprot:EPY18004.1 hypothetical protein STCU_10258 [Strigomonas culicis]